VIKISSRMRNLELELKENFGIQSKVTKIIGGIHHGFTKL
jgi:hypothetical protein